MKVDWHDMTVQEKKAGTVPFAELDANFHFFFLALRNVFVGRDAAIIAFYCVN